MPGVGSLIKAGLTISGVNKVQKLEHKEIVELADKYLLVLELRAMNSEFMLMKFKDFSSSS